MSSERLPPDSLICLRHVSKKYPIYDRPADKLLELLTLRRKQFHREFWALSDVDLQVSPGTTLGIIGTNGSGKSTLLQIIAGILQQTRGDCHVKGNVAALLELGAGFNPEFSGRENVYMSGVINGLTHAEVEGRFEEILEFSGIGQFIDQPVKTYSSGMFVRLAFSVAIHVDPDILLVDEALAVGDLIFQHQCVNRIRRLREQGKTILFVTHDLQALTKFCDRAILLDGGRKIKEGSPQEVAQSYQALILERERGGAGPGDDFFMKGQDEALPMVNTIPHIHNRYGKGGAEIQGVILINESGQVVNEAVAADKLTLLVTVLFPKAISSPIIGFTVRDKVGVEVTASNTSYEDVVLPPVSAGEKVTAAFQFVVPQLRPDSYSISPAVAQGNIWEHTIEDWIDNAYVFSIADSGLVYGSMKWEVNVRYRAHEGV